MMMMIIIIIIIIISFWTSSCRVNLMVGTELLGAESGRMSQQRLVVSTL